MSDVNLISVNGLQFMARDKTSDAQAIKEVVERRGYKRKGFDILPGETWLDLGANIGAFSCYAASLGANVIAYEPDINNHELAVQNVALNMLTATIHQRAVVNDAYEGNTATFFLSNTDYGQWRNSLIQGNKKRSVTVPVTRFSDLPPCDGMKMDIEGAEMPILETFDFTPIKKLVFEYHFDIDTRVSRYRAIVDRMRSFYTHVHAPSIKPEIEHYTFFPPAKIVFCWND